MRPSLVARLILTQHQQPANPAPTTCRCLQTGPKHRAIPNSLSIERPARWHWHCADARRHRPPAACQRSLACGALQSTNELHPDRERAFARHSNRGLHAAVVQSGRRRIPCMHASTSPSVENWNSRSLGSLAFTLKAHRVTCSEEKRSS